MVFSLGAGVGIVWKRSEVTAIVLVKPGIGGFEPTDGSAIGNTWQKADVKPVLLVKPGVGGFEPREGTSIGNTWSKADIIPVMLVEPSVGNFIPIHALSENGPVSLAAPISPTAPSGVVESKTDGEFNGWSGDTVVKLENGQIWEQSEYYYEYHYAFKPQVLIYSSSSGFKMKVDGVDKAVGVKQLK